MKKLKEILQKYCNEQITLKEMIRIVNETMNYKSYKAMGGKRYLKAESKGEIIEVVI